MLGGFTFLVPRDMNPGELITSYEVDLGDREIQASQNSFYHSKMIFCDYSSLIAGEHYLRGLEWAMITLNTRCYLVALRMLRKELRAEILISEKIFWSMTMLQMIKGKLSIP